MMKNLYVPCILVVVLLSLMFIQCEQNIRHMPYEDLQYNPGGALPGVSRTAMNVVVVPFEELAPYVMPNEPGENIDIRYFETTANMERFSYRFSKWLAKELSSAGIFRQVEFDEWGNLVAKSKNADLVITGSINKYENDFSFCLPDLVFPCACLTLAGILPISYDWHEFNLDIKVLDPHNPDRVIWKKSYKVEDPDMGLKFENFSHHSKYVDNEMILNHQIKLLQPVYRDAIRDMAKELKTGGAIYNNMKAGR